MRERGRKRGKKRGKKREKRGRIVLIFCLFYFVFLLCWELEIFGEWPWFPTVTWI